MRLKPVVHSLTWKYHAMWSPRWQWTRPHSAYLRPKGLEMDCDGVENGAHRDGWLGSLCRLQSQGGREGGIHLLVESTSIKIVVLDSFVAITMAWYLVLAPGCFQNACVVAICFPRSCGARSNQQRG